MIPSRRREDHRHKISSLACERAEQRLPRTPQESGRSASNAWTACAAKRHGPHDVVGKVKACNHLIPLNSRGQVRIHKVDDRKLDSLILFVRLLGLQRHQILDDVAEARKHNSFVELDMFIEPRAAHVHDEPKLDGSIRSLLGDRRKLRHDDTVVLNTDLTMYPLSDSLVSSVSTLSWLSHALTLLT